MGIVEYLIIGYLIILFLVTAYFRRDSENKLKTYLSYSFLYSACLSTLGFFAVFYLIDNYENYIYIYLICSLIVLIISSLIAILKFKHEK